MQNVTTDQAAPVLQGLVVSYFGNSVAVEADDGQVFQCHLKRNQALPVVGDRVQWQPDKAETGKIIAVEPRRSVLGRGDGRGQMKPIAANVDLILIVMAPPPIFSEYLVDRYLVAAELLNIPALLVLNKADLLDDGSRAAALERLALYQKIPYPVVLTSIYNEASLVELAAALHGKSAVLVGPSGVGKSSLISHLVGGEEIRIGDVSARGAGKHTTTATRLYHLPAGGSLIDSPGVREFNLWPVTREEIWQGFKEFQQFETGCKFRDCRHLAEPGCSVQDAINGGKIRPERYKSYLELLKQAKVTSYPKK